MKIGGLLLLVCALLAGVNGLAWGWAVSNIHYEAGVFLGLLIFWLGFKILVNNAKYSMRGRDED